MKKPKIISCDAVGTVFDYSALSRDELCVYVDQFMADEYSPLRLPPSWEKMPPHRDSRKAIARLRTKFAVVALSNVPTPTLARMSKNAGIEWDDIVSIAHKRVFKPDRQAYLAVCEAWQCEPADVLMVTANERLGRHPFGDVEAARVVGMQSVLIRGNSHIWSLQHLADWLGCD